MGARLSFVFILMLAAGCQALLEGRQPLGLCGDGELNLDADEECDDGNRRSGDGCSASCREEVCGNGVIDVVKGVKEECDAGKLNDDGGDCTRSCKKARCGDKYLKLRGTPPFEICDDGNTENGDGCNPDCSLRGRVSVLRGSPGGLGFADGTGPAARFAGIWGVAGDEDYLYLSDNHGCAIRRLELATGEVRTVAGRPGQCRFAQDGAGAKAGFTINMPQLALVGQALYVGERHLVRRVELADGQFTVDSCLELPQGGVERFVRAMASDPKDSSRFYLATEHGVYRVKLPCTCDIYASGGSACAAELLAGGVASKAVVDGVGTAARFATIGGLALDPSHKLLYVADAATVRQLDLSTLKVETKAGSTKLAGHVDGIGAQARFYPLYGLAHGAGAELYAVESSLVDERINGVVVASLYGWANVRRVETQTWKVETIAGTHGTVLSGKTPEVDGFGRHARFMQPYAVTRVGGILYVGQAAALRAVSLTAPHQVATAAGALVQDFTHYQVLAVAARGGKVYAATYAGELLELPVLQAGPTRSVGLCPTIAGVTHKIEAIAVDGSRLYVLDVGLAGVCRVDLDGKLGKPCCAGCKESCAVVFQLPGQEKSEYFDWRPRGLAFDGTQLYVPDRRNGRIVRVDPAKGASGSYTALTKQDTIHIPWGLTYLAPYLYATSPSTHLVLRVDPKTGSTRAIGDGQGRTVDGMGTKASFCSPAGIGTDGVRLFVGEGFCGVVPGEWHGHAVRQVDLAAGAERVTTLVGPSPEAYVVEGAGRRGGVNWPAAVAYDGATRSLYVADYWDNVLLQID